MKRLLFGFISILFLLSGAFGEEYLNVSQSDTDENKIYGWKVYTHATPNVSIKNIKDSSGKRTIELKGNGIKSGYMLGAVKGDNAWKDKERRLLEIHLTNFDIFTFYVPLMTSNGIRYLTYTTHPEHINKRGKEGRLIYVGLDEAEQQTGKEKIIKRNLLADLKRYEPKNKILEVNALMIRGNTHINFISLGFIVGKPPVKGVTLYEDGSTPEKWRVYAGGEKNGKITTYFHTLNYVSPFQMISLKGNGIKSGYMLGANAGSKAWHNKTQPIINWTVVDAKIYTIYIPIKTSKGYRYLTYTTHPKHSKKRGKEGRLIYVGLNTPSGYGNQNFQKFTKNLREDLQRYEPDNKLLEVNGFTVRGSCYIDDITLEEEDKTASVFDIEKFNQLLEKKKAKLIKRHGVDNVKLYHSKEKRARVLAWFDIPSYDGTRRTQSLYTLNKKNTALKSFFTTHPFSFITYDVKFLDNNRYMVVTVDNDPKAYGKPKEHFVYDMKRDSHPFLTQSAYTYLPYSEE